MMTSDPGTADVRGRTLPVSRWPMALRPPAAAVPEKLIVRLSMTTLHVIRKANGIRRRDIHWQRQPLAPGVLTGKQMAVIGGTNGIGRALARTFAAKGAEVVVVGRTFRDGGVERLRFIAADLSQMTQAHRVAQELPVETMDTLIFTSGSGPSERRKVSSEGVELDLAISYLSRFVIVRGVAQRSGANRTEQISKPRVFVMGGPGVGIAGDPSDLNADRTSDYWHAHMNTVAGNEALVIDGASRYPGVNFYGLNPGLVKSDIRSHFLGAGSFRHRFVEGLIGILFGGPDEYAEHIAPLIVSPEIEQFSGAMFNKRGEATSPVQPW
jgi:NAD(P)-dependent dehydrogenase (short-subunit alcohol dehydrogenase family)